MRLFVAAACAAMALAPGAAAEVELVSIPNVREFDGATEPNAIRYACGPKQELSAYFAERNLVFDPDLVRKFQGRTSCHIHYEPTLPGFRAATEDRPLTGLVAAAHPGAFNLRRRPTGDSLAIIKRVLAEIETPLEISLRINEHYDSSYWPDALAHHFPNSPHDIEIQGTPGVDTHPWAQDFIKSGSLNGELKILVPRRIFEGRVEDGEIHRPMLDGLQGDQFVRSKLSWDGGDLLFVKNPKDPSKHIILYGGSEREYWGESLPDEDYDWVLKTEFGADLSVALPQLTAHVDYVFSFLPNEPTAFVAEAVRENEDVALAALDALEELWGPSTPKALGMLRLAIEEMFRSPNPDNDVDMVRQRIAEIREKARTMLPPVEEALARDLEAWVDEHCPDVPLSCFDQVDGNRKMLALNPDLARRTADFGATNEMWTDLAPRLLSLVEGQMPTAPEWHPGLIDRKARELKKYGFNVIRTPQLLVYEDSGTWPGVGYTNMLTVGNKIFMPTFELGEIEQRLIANVQKKLGNQYQIIQAPARMSFLNNGGVHCVFGPIRQPEPVAGVTSSASGASAQPPPSAPSR